MKQRIKVGDGYWKMFIYYMPDGREMDEMSDLLHYYGCSREDIARVRRLSRCCLNTGATYTNPSERTSIVCINGASEGGQFLNTTAHELVHVAVKVCECYRVSLRGERFAYLVGHLICKAYPAVVRFLLVNTPH